MVGRASSTPLQPARSLFERKLESVLLEMPYMIWSDKPGDEPLAIPGTDKTFYTMIDLRLERWAREEYNRISFALQRAGVVGKTNSGEWVYFRQNEKTDPTVRLATPEEIETLEQLPEGWEDYIGLDAVAG